MDWKPAVMMMAVVIMYAVLNVMTKIAFNEGMHTTVFIVLRLLVAALFLSPIAYFKERKSRPKLTIEIFGYLFLSALLGASLLQWLFFLGLRYTTATFASAFNNTTPMFTFLLALAFKIEKINVANRSGAAKLTGTAVGLAGAMVLALYQGPTLIGAPAEHLATAAAHRGAGRWVMGLVALLGFSASWSMWFILQSKIWTKYPALYSSTAWMFLLSFVQMAVVGAATEKMTLEVWVPVSALGFLAMTWCVEWRGPVFTTAFMPLIQIITAGIDVAILHEQLHLGSMVGSVIVVVGLYSILWGKSNEASTIEAGGPL
ncbi:hypothetical protein VPH35_108339 [Triticum aestivum]